MTTRTDVLQDFNEDPRITTVQAPSVLFEVQDVVDTLRIAEYQFESTTHQKLLNAEGKTSLGQGRTTDITATLQNDVIEFEARRGIAESGTVTTGTTEDARGLIELIDTAADFVGANVRPGSFVINWDDQSVTDVRRVVDGDTLLCKGLVNGVDNLFELNDAYHVFNIVQCEVPGNVVAVDENGAEISAFLPSAFTQIVTARTTSGVIINADVEAFWDALLADHQVTGSFGEYVGLKLLNFGRWLALRGGPGK